MVGRTRITPGDDYGVVLKDEIVDERSLADSVKRPVGVSANHPSGEGSGRVVRQTLSDYEFIGFTMGVVSPSLANSVTEPPVFPSISMS